MSGVLDPGPDSAVVFYARDIDAFAELAAETGRLHGTDGQVLLDGHLPPGPTDQPLVRDAPIVTADPGPAS